APCDSRDWDSLAYHLAVPKIWIQAQQVTFVPGIHHANFPFTVDMLNVWGLQWGGQEGAKAFSLGWYVLGAMAVFGLTRRTFGPGPAPWAMLGFLGCPVALWEAGTAYVDLPHGLFAGLGILYACHSFVGKDQQAGWLATMCLGSAMGTKHTGIQVIVAVTLVGLALTAITRAKSQGKQVAVVLLGALLIASPWYIKSTVQTGNPVYPFFYKQLGGKFWNDWRADIYQAEQKSFGPGYSPTQLGDAVFGLAYQPGRYVNPRQTEGGGFPTGSIGFAALALGFVAMCLAPMNRRSKAVLAVVGVCLAEWFVLSQQSRYLVMIVVPLAVVACGTLEKTKSKWLARLAMGVQAAYSLGLIFATQTLQQLPVVTGQVTREEYQRVVVPFFGPAQDITASAEIKKLALYDEVFGSYLNIPYMWANPGHSTLIPYESMTSGRDYADAMVNLGFSHAYVNLGPGIVDRQTATRWLEAMTSKPYSSEELTAMKSDPNLWWRAVLADAVQKGRLTVLRNWPSTGPVRALLFEFTR
ncbi:MAG: glycosyltransferase family 39 protein, partial [Chthonomonadaceae bacterium]|nr:glycosyltransferase family 39 protein [Chthonomonadaceae bacterium]